MLSPTLREGLEHYGIGEKLRKLRLRKKLGLVQLGEHTGLSPALLSKLERNQLFPTLPTLLRIAMVYSVGLEYFFTAREEEPVVAVVRGRDRIALPEDHKSKSVAFTFESLDFPAVERNSSAYLVTFLPLSTEELHQHEHPGSEFIYVMTGKLELNTGQRRHILKKNDSVYFDASVSHGYRRLGSSACNAIVVTVP